MVLSLAKWGNSQALRIPHSLLRLAKLSKNEKFNVSVDGRKITLEPMEALPTLSELLVGWDGKPPEKYDWGEPFGREVL
jgi:antitoxin MazE